MTATEITVSKGVISHKKSGKSGGFGMFAKAAAEQEIPVDPPLKKPENFVLIGTDRPKLDSRMKSNGEARFALDVYREGMQTVTVAHPPQFGAKVKSVNSDAAMKIKGVQAVEEIPQGVAVYAKNTFAAFKGRDALEIEWDTSEAEKRSSAQMLADWRTALDGNVRTAEESGDVNSSMSDAQTVLEAEYVFPFLAHAPMEPIDGVIEVSNGEAQVWFGAQLQTVDHGTIAATLGVPQDKVKLHTMFAGGSFGRRAQPGSPVAKELADIAKAGGEGTYKMIWSRLDDVRGGYYRPLTVHRLRGGLDGDGNIVAWENDIANQSIVAGSAFEMLMQDGLDPTSYEGSTKMPYAWPAHRVGWAQTETKVPPLWWRAVGHTHTAYATETFLDELLDKGGKDPITGRLQLIKDSPRDAAVLKRVAEIANWSGAKGKEGRAFGVSLHESFGTYIAMIAEVSEVDGLPRTHKVWAAVDCGIAVNPNIIRAQVEGGVGYGLSAAMFNAITLGEGGLVEQANFDDYRQLRIDEMPAVEVAIIQSAENPTGIGEPGVPPIAPAVANAWRALTGTSVRELPFQTLKAEG